MHTFVKANRQVLGQEKQKILKLDFEQDLDFLIVGIISGHKDFRLCFELNKALRLRFARKDDIVISAGKPGSSTSHARFLTGGNASETYNLIGNRDLEHTGFFIPEMRNVDYFFLVSGYNDNFDLAGMVEKMRKVNAVSGAFIIQPDGLKSAETFLNLIEN
ncbi:MAG: IPExxxVDY family protein [Flavobacteriales bacterium]